MRTRTLGRTDLRLSELALGTWGLAEQSYGPVAPERFDEVLRAGIEHGITTFDVAPLWGDGEAERKVGHWVRETKLDDAVIVTRAGARRVDGRLSTGFSVEELIADCDGSLERLGREQIDLLLLHDPGDAVLRRDDWREAIDRLEEEGKVRTWGVSVGDADEARLAITKGAQAICLTYNLLRTIDLDDLVPEIARSGCGVLARSPLAYGMLAGQWGETRTFAPGDHRARRWKQPAFVERIRQVNALRFLVGPEHADLATAALRFVLSSGEVSAAIIGARSPYQVMAAVEAANGPRISDDDVMRLAKVRVDAGM